MAENANALPESQLPGSALSDRFNPSASITQGGTKPTYLTLNLNGIPQELREIPAWVGWRAVYRDGRWTKRPVDIKTNQWADVTDSASWASFDQTVANYARWDCDGIGLCRTKGLLLIDLDGCTDDHGGVLPGMDWAKRYVAVASGGAYIERSVSGFGLRIMCRGEWPHGASVKTTLGDHIGYESCRYVTVTGHRLPQSGPIHDLTDDLALLHRELCPEPIAASPTQARPIQPVALSDEELLDKARSAKNGAKFRALWDGAWQDADAAKGQSEADAALCAMLAYWTGRDSERIDRLFRQSKLFRDKWNRKDYRDGTIRKAIANCEEVYRPKQQVLIPIMNVSEVPNFWEVEDVPIQYIDETELLVKNAMNMFAGQPGHGKTTLAVRLAANANLKHGCPVLYLDRENPVPGMKDMTKRLGINRAMPAPFKWWGSWVKMTVDGKEQVIPAPDASAAAIVEWVKSQGNCIVIIDSLAAYAASRNISENSSNEMRSMMDPWRNLLAYGATIILIHHTGKAETAQESRGSSAIKDAVDRHYVVVNKTDSGGLELDTIYVVPAKTRLGVATQKIFKYDDGKFTWDRANLAGQQEIARILTLILENHPGGITATKFIEEAKKAGISKTVARPWVQVAVEAGEVKAIRGKTTGRGGVPPTIYRLAQDDWEPDDPGLF